MASSTLFDRIIERTQTLNYTFSHALGHLGRARRSRTALFVLVASVILVGLVLRGAGDVRAS
jgi:hypothetical protein